MTAKGTPANKKQLYRIADTCLVLGYPRENDRILKKHENATILTVDGNNRYGSSVAKSYWKRVKGGALISVTESR